MVRLTIGWPVAVGLPGRGVSLFTTEVKDTGSMPCPTIMGPVPPVHNLYNYLFHCLFLKWDQ